MNTNKVQLIRKNEFSTNDIPKSLRLCKYKHFKQSLFMKKILSLLFVLCSFSAFAQTTVSGGIYTNTTWTKANSPYYVNGNLVVFDEVTLTIEPGVEIQVEDNVLIEIRNGRLVALGTATDSIIFKISPDILATQVRQWEGIKLWGSTFPYTDVQLKMAYCVGQNAKHFLDFDDAHHGPYHVKHSSFSQNESAVYSPNNGGQYYFDSCTFTYNEVGIYYGSACEASHCLFDHNGKGAVDLLKVTDCQFTNHSIYGLESYGVTQHCVFSNNALGVNEVFNGVNNDFTYNTIENNGIGMLMGTYFNGTVQFHHNTFCNNSQYNIKRDGNWAQNAADLSNNCWCGLDSLGIEASIYDAKDDLTMGVITFMPMLTDCSLPVIDPPIPPTPPTPPIVTQIADEEAYKIGYEEDKMFVISKKNIPIYDLRVTDISGNVVYEDINDPNQYNAMVNDINCICLTFKREIDIAHLNKGFYIVQVNKSFVKKFIKY